MTAAVVLAAEGPREPQCPEVLALPQLQLLLGRPSPLHALAAFFLATPKAQLKQQSSVTFLCSLLSSGCLLYSGALWLPASLGRACGLGGPFLCSPASPELDGEAQPTFDGIQMGTLLSCGRKLSTAVGQRPRPQPLCSENPSLGLEFQPSGQEGAFSCKGVLAAGSGWMEMFNLTWNATFKRVSTSQQQAQDTHLCSYFKCLWYLENRC